MYVVEQGRPAYVLVPIEEYEQLIKSSMVKSAADKLENTPESSWLHLDVFRLQLAGERIAAARKQAGLTQQQLAKRLDMPQSQISRIERNPDATTVRTLKKIARSLGVDIAALV